MYFGTCIACYLLLLHFKSCTVCFLEIQVLGSIVHAIFVDIVYSCQEFSLWVNHSFFDTILFDLKSRDSSELALFISKLTNPPELYIQILTLDLDELWFVGFFNYDSTLTGKESTGSLGWS